MKQTSQLVIIALFAFLPVSCGDSLWSESGVSGNSSLPGADRSGPFAHSVMEKAELKGGEWPKRAVAFGIAGFLYLCLCFKSYECSSVRRHGMAEKERICKGHMDELASKDRQLTVMRDMLIRKSGVMERLERMRSDASTRRILLSDDNWRELETLLDGVDDLFVARMRRKFSNLNESDIHLMMLLRLRMPQKALANIYCISERAVKQKLYLYKSKVGINGGGVSLREFVEAF